MPLMERSSFKSSLHGGIERISVTADPQFLEKPVISLSFPAVPGCEIVSVNGLEQDSDSYEIGGYQISFKQIPDLRLEDQITVRYWR